MKHIILLTLLTLGVWAEEIGVPYVDTKNIQSINVIKGLYFESDNVLIAYRNKDGYIIKNLTNNKILFQIKPSKCVVDSRLSQVVCISGDAYRDGEESVDLYQIGHQSSTSILKCKYLNFRT